jgi:limonene-1,2-epoxide hydrolase
MSEQMNVVREFMGLIDKAVTERKHEDAERMFALMADDIQYHSKPMRRVSGKKEFLTWHKEFATCTQMRCDIIRMAQDGNWVLTERRDIWTVNGVKLAIDVMGSFEVRNGKIQTWNDYIVETEKWRSARQMPEGFFERWADPTPIVQND